MMAKLNVPGIDMDALVATQRYNLKALSDANRAAMEGMKEAAEWQVKILKETMEEVTHVVGELAKVHSPKDMAAENADLSKQAFETAVKNMRELAEIVNKANKQATDAIVERVPESLEEIKEVFKIKQQSSGA